MTHQEILDQLNAEHEQTLVRNLGIVFTAFDGQSMEATMPIDERTMRPGRILNGGAIMALADVIGGALTYVLVPPDRFHIFGIEVNGNHVHKAEGTHVTARAEFIHRGRRTHVVDVRVRDASGRLASVCRVTNIIMPVDKTPSPGAPKTASTVDVTSD